MNKYSAKLSGLNRVNWNNKTEKQKANYFKKAYAELGLNIPKYMLDGKMSEKQLISNINKLTRSLQSRAKKQQKQQKSNEYWNKRVKKAVEDRNKAVIETLDKLVKKYDLTETTVNYLMGNQIDLGTNKLHFMQGKTLRLISADKLSFRNNQAKKNFINLLKQDTRELADYEKMLIDDSSSNQWFEEEYLDAEFMQELTENDRKNMRRVFNQLNPIQKRFIIHDLLNQQKEKYENMADDDIGYEVIGKNVFNNFMIQVDRYKNL